MKVGVVGLWHLGSVTAACLAGAGLETVGVDFDATAVEGLAEGRAPLFEPGLDDLLAAGLSSGKLSFTTDPAGVAGAGVVWVAYDTPVDDDDRADVDFVLDAFWRVAPHVKDGAVVLISSQLPVGTTRATAERFAQEFPDKRCHFAYSPENLRLGGAIQIFSKADRIVVGVDSAEARTLLERLLSRFSENLLFISIESAEMTKHALNAFLATSVTFANEVANLCEKVGADAMEVERALKSESRIGPKAYLRPGAAFAGGTLARDVIFLGDVARQNGVATPLLESIPQSNAAHRLWPIARVEAELGSVEGKRIAVLGLVYKPGTSTLRRSSAVEACRALNERGATVVAHDPALSSLPADLDGVVTLAPTVEGCVAGADAIIVATEWPEFRELSPDRLGPRPPVVIDANGFLRGTLGSVPALRYLTVGRP
ncbi:MAG TPA: nucleotide sugar dehydrogenase [Beijerinckiaceae bacterium]|jgi:UDPglucose 6-dehydrogenase